MHVEDKAVSHHHKYEVPSQNGQPVVVLIEENQFSPKLDGSYGNVGEVVYQRNGKDQEGPLEKNQHFFLLS